MILSCSSNIKEFELLYLEDICEMKMFGKHVDVKLF